MTQVPAPSVDQAAIEQGLRDLGVAPGMGLMVHSSLSSFGHVEGGAATVVAALMAVLTPQGTLLMPSFNHGAPFRADGPGFFDPQTTPTTNGAIPDHVWRQPGVHRSLNPTHPFAAWGANAQEYISGHHRTLTMGPDSPLGRLHSDDGACLLLGVDYRTNTFHHVVEMGTGAPCLGRRTEVYPVALPDGRRVMGRTWGWRRAPCPLTDKNRYADRMRAHHRQVTIGRCRATLYPLRAGFAVIADVLAHGRAGFPPCRRCPIRPRRVSQTVPSDWDADRGRVYPWSEALTY